VSSTAQMLFDSLNTKAQLQALVDGCTPETLYSEFKRKSDERDGTLNETDKRNFSKSLSAFANSDGGVLVWGIGSAKRDGRDVACDLRPIVDVVEFRSRLGQYLKDAVQPYVDGVRLEVIEGPTAGVGYLKCLIPVSEKTPHRAMCDRECYKRSAESSYRLEHFDLEDMFGRRQRPYLELFVDRGDADANGFERLTFSMENQGRALARHIGFRASSSQIDVVHTGQLGFEIIPNAEPGVTTFACDAPWGSILHPIPVREIIGVPVLFKRRAGGSVMLKVTWYCEHMRSRQREFSFD
jgi:hypothetical protein